MIDIKTDRRSENVGLRGLSKNVECCYLNYMSNTFLIFPDLIVQFSKTIFPKNLPIERPVENAFNVGHLQPPTASTSPTHTTFCVGADERLFINQLLSIAFGINNE
jgi:hypothetical protein